MKHAAMKLTRTSVYLGVTKSNGEEVEVGIVIDYDTNIFRCFLDDEEIFHLEADRFLRSFEREQPLASLEH